MVVKVAIPEVCLVVLVGVSGAGKTTFARHHFRPSEVVSSDHCRLLVADDENDQSATPSAFEVLHTIVDRRLAGNRLTVVDATNLESEARSVLLALAREHHIPAVAVVLDIPVDVCEERSRMRDDNRPHGLTSHQSSLMRDTRRELPDEGFSQVIVLDGPDQVAAATIERLRRSSDRRDLRGPFDIIGDIHGCFDELIVLMERMGYEIASDGGSARHPEGRRVVFLGDMVDRGPNTPGVLRLAMGMVREGEALCLPGNHEAKLVQAIQGRRVQISHGLAESLDQLGDCSADFRADVVDFVNALPSHLVLDGGRLVVAHAGLPEHLQNRASNKVNTFALYGDTTGETDEFGSPVRYPWAEDYRGAATVVYGHTPVPVPEWVNNTICVDTGCVYGGALTALRYPEMELESVPAAREYHPPRRRASVGGGDPPPEQQTGQRGAAAQLDEWVVHTRWGGAIALRGEDLAWAQTDVAGRNMDRPWFVHLPPRIPAGPPSHRGDLLEHPEEVFAAYRNAGVGEVLCEYRHAGTSAVVVMHRDADAAARRLGEDVAPGGVVYTPDGRLGSDGTVSETRVLNVLRSAADSAGVWESWRTNWLVLEIVIGLSASDGLRLAPVTVLAGEPEVYAQRDRLWQMEAVERLHQAAPHEVVSTRHKRVETADVMSRAEGIAWWQDLTSGGGEGMVVRVLGPVSHGLDGSAVPVQPGLLCRGPEHLTKVFGAGYQQPDTLSRLRSRDLRLEWSLAVRQFALGMEGLERLVRGAPLEQTLECPLAVLSFDRVLDAQLSG